MWYGQQFTFNSPCKAVLLSSPPPLSSFYIFVFSFFCSSCPPFKLNVGHVVMRCVIFQKIKKKQPRFSTCSTCSPWPLSFSSWPCMSRLWASPGKKPKEYSVEGGRRSGQPKKKHFLFAFMLFFFCRLYFFTPIKY